LNAERNLLTHLNGALFSLAGLRELVTDLSGSEHFGRFVGDIHLLEITAYHLILDVERSGINDGQ